MQRLGARPRRFAERPRRHHRAGRVADLDRGPMPRRFRADLDRELLARDHRHRHVPHREADRVRAIALPHEFRCAACRPAMRPNTRQRPSPCWAKPPWDSPAQYSPGITSPRMSITCALVSVRKPGQRVMQDRRRPRRIERRLRDLVQRRGLVEVGIDAGRDERIVAVHRLLQHRAGDRLLLVRIPDPAGQLEDRVGAGEIAVRIDMRRLRASTSAAPPRRHRRSPRSARRRSAWSCRRGCRAPR